MVKVNVIFFNKESHTKIGYGDDEMENNACKEAMHGRNGMNKLRNELQLSFKCHCNEEECGHEVIYISGKCQAPTTTTTTKRTTTTTTIATTTKMKRTTTTAIASTTGLTNGTLVTPKFEILCGNVDNFKLSNVTMKFMCSDPKIMNRRKELDVKMTNKKKESIFKEGIRSESHLKEKLCKQLQIDDNCVEVTWKVNVVCDSFKDVMDNRFKRTPELAGTCENVKRRHRRHKRNRRQRRI